MADKLSKGSSSSTFKNVSIDIGVIRMQGKAAASTEQPGPRRASLQSQHSSFEDPVTVHPLRNLLLSIKDEIEQEAVHQLISLCRSQLGDQYGDLVNECDILSFFNVLECRQGTDYAVNFIETCLEHEQLHGDHGSCKLSDQIQQYKEEKAQYQLESPLDPHFIGREECMADIIQTLQNNTTQCFGVVIYGESGTGKSSLAREVCHKLRNSDMHWLIKPVNLRGICTLREVLQALHMHLSGCHSRWNDLANGKLRSEVLNAIRDKVKYRCIIWLDNADCLCDTADELKSLADFLNETTSLLNKEDACHTKLLVTMSVDEPPCLSQYFRMIELSCLSCEDCERFLRQQSDIPEKAHLSGLRDIIRGHPLALRITGSLLRTGKCIDELKTYSTEYSGPASVDHWFERCFETAFHNLDEKSQTLIIKLSVFHTVPFSLESAIIVASDDATIVDKPKCIKQKLSYNLMVELTHLRLSNFTEDPNLDQESNSGTVFSLHPQIVRCLQNFKVSHDFEEAKISFCKYFCTIICKYARELDSEGDKASNFIWHQNFHHCKTWFLYVMNEPIAIDRFYKYCHCRPVLLQCRIWRVAQTVLRTTDQLKFLQQQSKFANLSSDWLPVALWLTFQAQWYINENRPKMAVQIMTEVPGEFKPLSPEVMGNKVDDNDKLQSFLKRITEKYSKSEVFEVIIVNAFICKIHGILLMMNPNLLKTSKSYLKLALKLFSGKIGKADVSNEICKEIKHSYKTQVDKIKECLTVVRQETKTSLLDFSTQYNKRHAWLSSRFNRKRSSSEIDDYIDTSVDSSIDKSVDSDSFDTSSIEEHEHNESEDTESAQGRLTSPNYCHFKARRRSSNAQYLRLSSGSLNRLESQTSVTSLMDSLTTQVSGSFEEEGFATASPHADSIQHTDTVCDASDEIQKLSKH